MDQDWNNAKVLFHFNGVPVKVRPSFWPMWLSSWPLLIWLAKQRNPERSWWQCVFIGTVAMPIPVTADVGHALAHTVTAKAAYAPMDEVRLAADMPRTIYFDNAVTPDQHRLRAVGGPIFSGLGFVISLLLRRLTNPKTPCRELTEIACVSHGLLFFGSLLPVSIVDGGTLLKWTLVDKGLAPVEADKRVRQASFGAGLVIALLAVMGVFLRWKCKGSLKND